MGDAWDRAASLADKHTKPASRGGIFVNLDHDCDRVIGAFVGEPYAYGVHWTGERYVECEGDDCQHCKTAGGATVRVMLNFFVPAEDAMKVIEGGTVWFKDVLKVRDKYGLDKWLFEITRHGESGDPTTTYSIMPEEKIDDELRAKIDAAANSHELHDLSKLQKLEEVE